MGKSTAERARQIAERACEFGQDWTLRVADLTDDIVELVAEKDAEIERLRTELDGINESYRATMAEVCGDSGVEEVKQMLVTQIALKEAVSWAQHGGVVPVVIYNKWRLALGFEPLEDN